ncbi:MAG: HAMP domain-containing protein [Deltaproteobacteria bacterium]|nr:HAMP domain-containing protein [Deltaproteobacteria bacterium]
MSERRSSLWADVVLNLAILTVITVVLNAVLLWRLGQGREQALRADLASELSRSFAVRLGGVADSIGPPDPTRPGPWRDALRAADVPGGTNPFVVVVNSGVRPVATLGPLPSGVEDTEKGLQSWVLEGIDVRAAIAGNQIERGEWTVKDSLFAGQVHAVATAPVSDLGGRVIGAVRVALPVGVPLIGPVDRRTLPVFGVITLLSAVGMGLFGFALFRRRILLPIGELERGTRELAGGHFEVRLGSDAANELGALAGQFDALALALETYRARNDQQVSDLKRINEDLQRTRKELVFAEKMATVGRLAAGVAHEVGNPLASIIGFVDLLDQDDDGSLKEDFLPRIRKELDRIHHIIRELLSYARPTENTAEELDTVDIAAPLDAARRLIEVQPRFKAVSFDEQVDPGLPRVIANEPRLQQVLLNLYVNAAEAMSLGGRIRTRAFQPETAPDVVQVEVQDEGPGLPPHVASHVFEPFFTTKDVGEGTGLGLSVSLRLMEGMNGSLTFREPAFAPEDSMMVGGATFVITLPVAPAETD